MSPTPSDEFIPGTVYLVALGESPENGRPHYADIVLHPQPSRDPEDPLNWSYRRKILSTFGMFTYAMTIAISSAAIYSVLDPISQATNLSVADLNAGTGYMFLSFGWGCLVWQPLGLAYGKRLVYLLTTFCTILIMIWAPFTTNNGQWIANKILQGFFGAPLEALCEISMTDIWFTHERGKYLTLYVLALYIANSIAPLIAAFITAGQGWKWVLYWCAIYNTLSFLFLYLFMEETNYNRTIEEDNGSSQLDITQHVRNEVEIEKTGQNHFGEQSSQAPGVTYLRKSFADKLALVDTKSLKRNPNDMWGQVVRPFLYLQFPVVVFCGISIGCYQMWLSFLNGTESTIMTESYGFSTILLGVPYVSPIIFSIFGYLYAGVFGDRFIVKMARRNDGIYEPEQRLWLLMPLIILAPGSQLLWGLGSNFEIHWIGPVIAMGVISFVTVVGVQICVSYCIDSYRTLSGEAIVTVILLRNNILFGVNYGITPWVSNMGLRNAYILAACLAFIQVMSFLAMIKYGKSCRARSVELYCKFHNQLKASNLVH